MKVSEAKFTRRYNVAQYEHEEYSLSAVVEDNETGVEVLQQLKAEVEAAKSGNAVQAAEPAAKKNKKPKPASTTKESDESENGESDTAADPSDTDSDTDDDADDVEETPAEKRKKFKKKPQVYQRSNDAHKELFSGVLKAVAPDWKKSPESKAKAKSVSQKLEGQEFLDESGEILPDFKAQVKKHMGKK